MGGSSTFGGKVNSLGVVPRGMFGQVEKVHVCYATSSSEKSAICVLRGKIVSFTFYHCLVHIFLVVGWRSQCLQFAVSRQRATVAVRGKLFWEKDRSGDRVGKVDQTSTSGSW